MFVPQGSTVNQNVNQKMYKALTFIPDDSRPQRLGAVLLVGKDWVCLCNDVCIVVHTIVDEQIFE